MDKEKYCEREVVQYKMPQIRRFICKSAAKNFPDYFNSD